MNPNTALKTTLIIIGLLSLNACNDKDTKQATKQNPASTPSPVNSQVIEGTESEFQKLSESAQLITDLGFSKSGTSLSNTNTKPIKATPFCLNKTLTTNSDAKAALTEECSRISKRLASVSMQSCLAAKLEETGCNSVLGFPIMVSNFAPIKGKSPQGKILIIGGTHADELTSVSSAFKWIETLNKHHSGLFHWHVAPLMNPDGLLKKSATRTNHNGIDLNRNMPSSDWHANALHYWQTKGGKNPRKYPGVKPSSEPETQWLVDEINDFEPDAIISIHAPYGVVDFDSLILNKAPKSLGKLHLNLLGTYPGSLGNYAGINKNIPVITVELPHAWEMPSDAELTAIWEDIVSWLKKNINNDQQES